MKKTVILHGPIQYATAAQYVKDCPQGWVMTLTPPKRSNAQNDRMWAMLKDVAEQVEWYGRRLSPEDWKHVFSAATKQQDAVPGINGGFVVLGISTSRMTIREMADLITIIEAFGAEHGVKFGDDQMAA